MMDASRHTTDRRGSMNDQDIQDRIEAIELAEQRLRADEAAQAGEGDEALLAADRARLAELRVELDQLWDLLRRRRALRPGRRRRQDARPGDRGGLSRLTGSRRDCGDGGRSARLSAQPLECWGRPRG
jgi:hypothetical protein